MKSLIVSLHDVAPGSFEMVRRWMELLGERNVPVSVLVIPGPWSGGNLATDESFQAWLKQVSTDHHEIVLHGFSHQAKLHFPVKPWKVASGSVLARGCEEFWAINHSEARQRMLNGLAVFSLLGYEPSGFIAPGWLASDEAVEAMRELGFEYTNSHLRINDLVAEQKYFAPVVCQRTNTFSSRMVLRLTMLLSRALGIFNLPIRVAIHPADLHDPVIRRGILSIIDRAVASGYTAMTYEQFISNTRYVKDPAYQGQFGWVLP
jgi:hypothetical protein